MSLPTIAEQARQVADLLAAELRRLPARVNEYGERPGADALKAYEALVEKDEKESKRGD